MSDSAQIWSIETRSIDDVLRIETHPTEFGGSVLLWRLDRPDGGNAISLALLAALETAAAELAGDANARALIIAGGERFFCTGADLKERAGMSPDAVHDFLNRLNALLVKIEALAVPVIAALRGYALGGGLELALACDIRLAGDRAQLGLPETSLGIIPGAGGTQRLSRAVGLPRAKELIFTAARIGAARASELGVVNAVHPDAELESAALNLASATIARNAPIALRQAKLALNRGYDVGLAEGIAIEREAYAVTIPTEDRVEALAAFREKRPPRFQGR